MAVAFLRASRATSASSTSPQSFGPYDGSGASALVLFILVSGTSADAVSAVSFDGVAMTRVQRAADTAGEQGGAYVYFLGSGVAASGALTITHTMGTNTRLVVGVFLSASGDTEIAASNVAQGDQANPQIALDSGASDALRVCGVFSGLANTSDLSLLAHMSAMTDYQGGNATTLDFGQQVSRVDRETSPSSGSTTIGYTSSSDDIAMVAVAVKESAGAPAAEIPILVMPQMRAQ